MSDSQPIQTPPEDVELRGGWKKPEKTGGWKAPQPEPAEARSGGWKIPAMPPELKDKPAAEGAWHLPRPEDTRFGPQDEVEIGRQAALRPEDTLLPETAGLEQDTAEAAESPVEETSDLESYSGLGDLVATLAAAIETQRKPDILLEETAEAETETAEARKPADESEELDFGSPTQAEREALTQALTGGDQSTEVHPADFARQQIDWLTSAGDEDSETAEAAADPGAYARQQLAALQQDTQADIPTAPPTEAPSDPAAYARRQLEQLGGVTTTEPQALDPAQAELARKFQDTERQVRALRQQYRSGQITRDQLQQELRKYLVLDHEETWWMMGVDTDTWYRYDSAAGTWVEDTPPVPLRPGAPTATSEFTPDEVLRGQLPYLPEDEAEAEATAEDTAVTRGTEPFYIDPDMPLPRAGVPVTDPDATIPGNVAINQNTMRFSEADTLEAGFGAAPTIPAQPVVTTPYEPVSVYDTAAEPPLYEALDTESQIYEQAVQRQRQTTLRRLILVATLFIGGIFIIGTLFVLYAVVTYNSIASQYRDAIAALSNYQPSFQTVRVLDAAGNTIAELNSAQGGSREAVQLSRVSPELVYAIVGSQDPLYYETPGFDVLTIGGVFLENLTGRAQRSPSITTPLTINQFVADLVIASSPNAATASTLDEVVVASEIANQYDKNFILTLYLNERFFGNQSYGVEAAAQFYFNKPAAQVNLTEGALLASLLNDPIDHDPVPKQNRDRAFVVADEVLRQLATVGCLNFQHQPYGPGRPFCVDRNNVLRPNGEFTANVNLQRAEMQILPFRPRSAEGRYPHFVDYVRRELIREFGDEIYRRGFEVRTTLVPDLQNAATQALREQIRTQGFTGLQTGAVLVTDPASGAILAMVGSPDYNNVEIDGQTNNAFTWQLPGATIMPVVYARALEGIGDVNQNGRIDFDEYLTPASVLFDLDRSFQDPRLAVVNANNRYEGAVSLRQALANSMNVPTVKVFDYIGNAGYLDIARRMGLTFSSEPPVLAPQTGIGAVTDVRLWDMMKAYGILANTGQYVPLRAITQITDADNVAVPLPETIGPRQATAVISPSIAFLVQNILSDSQFYDQTFAPLFLPNYPGRTAVKINHLNDNRDMWAIGFSRNVVVGVWMGRPDDAATIANSRDAALPVWKAVIERALAGTNPAPFTFPPPPNLVQPGNIQSVVICVPTGTIPGQGCTQQRNELVAISNPPPPPDQGLVVTQMIDSWTRLIANDFCRDNVIQDQFVDLTPADPGAIAWLNTAAGRPTANRMGLPQRVQALPTGACELGTDLPVARIVSPTEGTSLTGTTSILGIASATRFDNYTLEVAPQGTNNFQLIAGPDRTPRPDQNATLGEWNTRNFPNGQYTLRLSMYSNTGGFVRREVNVVVLNPTPTPIIPTETPFVPVATPTTLPLFPTPFGTPFNGGIENNFPSQGIGGATPTPTLVIGG
jgi:membrane peptidoglycan carboxypeptidase